MDRIPEPELMDEATQAAAYAAADFSEPHEAFVAGFRRCFPEVASGRVLDLGCGPADVTIRFARAYPAAEITGVDGADAMLAPGREAVTAANLDSRVRLLQVCLPADAIPGSPFDGVISNSLLHHLHDPGVLWRSIVDAAAPDAWVFVMDLLRPPTREAAARLVDLHAADAPDVLRRDFFNSLLAAFRPDEVRQQLRGAGLSHFDVEVTSDRHLIAYGRLG